MSVDLVIQTRHRQAAVAVAAAVEEIIITITTSITIIITDYLRNFSTVLMWLRPILAFHRLV